LIWPAAILLLFFASFAAAQSYRGSIRGVVTDPSGAVIPNAAVTATSTATGQARTVQSGGDGTYVLAELPADNYTVTIQAPSFAKFTAKVDVAVGLDTTLDAQVRVQGTDIVEVNETTAPLVEETRDVLGQVVENRLVIELPLNGRDFGKLVALTPGVTVEGSGVAGTEKGFGQFNINGNRDRSNNYMLDGTDNNDPFFNNSALNQVGITGAPASLLPIDAIQEFNLQSQYAAEYGRNSGAAVNVLTKSGTNHLHGSVFYFLRNSALDARNYFNPDTNPDGTANLKGAFKNNQYGASIGGPIVKDKTFFFAAFEGQRERVTSNYTLFVPTATQIIDAQGFALANGVAPSAGLTKLLNYFPTASGCSAGGTPTSTGCLGGSGTVGGAVEDRNDLDNGIVKIDQYFSQSQQFSARYAVSNSNQVFPLGSIGGYGSGSRLADFAQTSPTRVNVASGSLLSTFSPSLLNELRFGYSRYNTSFSTLDAGVDPLAQFGLNMGTGKLGVPEIDFGGLLDNIGASAYSIPRGRTSQTYQVLDNVTRIHGDHTFKFGGEFRRSVIDNFNDNLERGLLALDTVDPNGYDVNGNPIGPYSTDPVEQLLTNYYLGFFDYGYNADTGNTQRTTFNNGFSFFAQDDWRIRKNLTLNLGLRWEYFGPLGETHNLLSNLGSDGLLHMTSQPYNKKWKNFGPRIGLAWNVFNGTVVRAGYGIYYDYTPQNNLIANYTASAGLATNPIGPQAVYSMDYNQGAFNGTAPGTPVFTTSTGPQNIFVVPQNFSTPYSQSWNLNIEQELGKSASLQIGYVGSKGTHLTRLYDANQDYTNPNYAAIDTLATISDSTYHALQTTFTTRSWKGVSGFANYTWSKSLDDASDGIDFNFASAAFPQNSDNPVNGEHGASTFDTRHRFTGSVNYAIPTWHAVPTLLGKGWELNTIATLQSGRPIPIITSNDTSGTYNYHQRPNLVPGVNPILPNWNPVTGYLNPLAFQQPADGTFGNLQRNSIYGPHYTNVDLSLNKTTPINEHMNVQFRAEFFNIFNHPNYALPNGTITPGVNADGTINTSAGPQGQITQTPDVAQGNPGLGGGGPRVIQFGLRLQF
jgi:outer membrane receptor protein involved in Fe transport